MGKPVVGVKIQSRDREGSEVPQGEIGMIWVTGPNIMLGYYNAPEATSKVLKDGWFDTGDLGYINERGKLVITGREKDLIIHKGFNIYPQEIENVLLSHADVIRAAVIGKPDEITGEVPVAIVQVRKDNPHLAKELRAMCKDKLAIYKIPREFMSTIKEPPLTATGKINKKRLRKDLYGYEKK